MTQGSTTPSNGARFVQLCLRDQALVEGTVTAADSTYLPGCLGNRNGWVNLTSVHFLNTGERLQHIAVQTNRVLWACSPNGDLELMLIPPQAASRGVEIQLEGGAVVRGHLSLTPK